MFGQPEIDDDLCDSVKFSLMKERVENLEKEQIEMQRRINKLESLVETLDSGSWGRTALPQSWTNDEI